MPKQIAPPIFDRRRGNAPAASPPPPTTDTIPSSSPAFGTPVYPIQQPLPTRNPLQHSRPSILPIALQPTALRPLAFRTFTKKHNLTLTSSALQLLATFVGKHCGAGWKEEGLAEKVLDATAKAWKKNGGGLIVSDEGEEFKKILRTLEGSISGGKLSDNHGLSRQSSFAFGQQNNDSEGAQVAERPGGLDRQDSLGLSSLEVADDEETTGPQDPRKWTKVIGAFEQPRFKYNTVQKHFEQVTQAASSLPEASHRTDLFRNRYNLIHQSLLRNDSFQTSSVAASRRSSLQRSESTLATAQQAYKLTPVGNLLGRNGTSHVLLGLLTISPTGILTLNDLTGSIGLDITHARPAPEDGAWFTPGMIVLVDGMYEEEGSSLQGLDQNVGVGGSIGGKFLVFSIGGPPCERRDVTLGVNASGAGNAHNPGGGFGWVDFLGVGSERASGSIMRRLEQKTFRGFGPAEAGRGRSRMILLGDVNLDKTQTLSALRKVFGIYDAEPADETPMLFVLFGNFASNAVMAGSRKSGSMEYKEWFDALASVMTDYPAILQTSTFIFVPGDNDPWASSFTSGASTMIPRDALPGMFTSRIRRVFANANSEAERSTGKKTDGEAVWSTNPARVSIFGPLHEIVLFRDNMSGRLRRNAVRFKPLPGTADGETAQSPGETIAESSTVNGEAARDVRMDVDPTIETAESVLPATKSKAPADSTTAAETQASRKLVKTILDQAYLSPFPTSTRPVLWDYASTLQLYPLPTALVLADPEATPFAISYQGCLVMNPGSLTSRYEKHAVRWIEYDVQAKQGILKDSRT